jgi:hypothetical protein
MRKASKATQTKTNAYIQSIKKLYGSRLTVNCNSWLTVITQVKSANQSFDFPFTVTLDSVQMPPSYPVHIQNVDLNHTVTFNF